MKSSSGTFENGATKNGANIQKGKTTKGGLMITKPKKGKK